MHGSPAWTGLEQNSVGRVVERWRWWKYCGSVCLAFLFSFSFRVNYSHLLTKRMSLFMAP